VPAFYSQWFLNRLKEGFVMVRNPMNPNLVSKIDLNPDLIDCTVFWTKNPRDMMDKLDQLKNYHFYFLFTVTSYGPDLEQRLPEKDEIIATFIELSEKIGREKVIWRYDPILLSDTIDEDFHRRQFEYIARRLHSHTERCIISFMDMYKKCERNLKGLNIKEPGPDDMVRLAEILNPIAKKYEIEMVTCAEEIDLSPIGVAHGKCIDDQLVSRICCYRLKVKKDSRQRKTCSCVESIDIGAYNTCNHICLYCYANSDAGTVQRNMALHNPKSPLLLGELSGDERIVERPVESFRKAQGELF
jgi:DNA repair photolyase